LSPAVINIRIPIEWAARWPHYLNRWNVAIITSVWTAKQSIPIGHLWSIELLRKLGINLLNSFFMLLLH